MPNKLQLLGGFRLVVAGEEVRLSSRKAKALLAVVALAPRQSATRAKLKALLWSDRGEDQASASLRQLLVALRKDLGPLGPVLLLLRDDSIGLDPKAVEIDVCRFNIAELAGDAAQSVTHYGGLLLDGLDIGDQAFEDWLAAERRKFLGSAIDMFERRVTELSGETRVAMAQRLVALDQLREASHRALISAYLANGEAALARKQFDTCKTLLARELGVAPAAQTEALLSNPPARGLAAKPTIAVLPFANLSDDPAQRYFSDGITADIVTELSRFHQLLLRAASNTHGAGGLNVGRELAVQYVAEGSVRRFGTRIRITVQLLDIETGQNLWAERFDADVEEIFHVQDKIVRSIASQLSDRLRIAVVDKASRKPPSNVAAYECFLQADALPIGVPEAAAEARRLCQKAIDLDPVYGRAHAFLADTFTLEWLHHLDASDLLLDQALDTAKKAVALDEGDDFCHAVLARAHLYRRSHDLAEFHYLKAFSINPNHSALIAGLGILYGFIGEPERALSYFREALTLNPHNTATWYWRNRAVVHLIAREYEQAIEGFKRSPIQPDWVEALLAASHAHLGRMDEARQHAAASLRLTPNLTIAAFLKKEPHRRHEDAEHVAEGLRKAGFPE